MNVSCPLVASDIRWIPEIPAPPVYAPDDLLLEALLDAEAYRKALQQALHQLHEVTLQRDVLQEQRWIDRRRAREQAV